MLDAAGKKDLQNMPTHKWKDCSTKKKTHADKPEYPGELLGFAINLYHLNKPLILVVVV